MAVRLIQVPYDSGHRARRMGAGPLRLTEGDALARLRRLGPLATVTVESSSPFVTEIGSAFELHRAVAAEVSRALAAGTLPLVLSGNCNASVGTVAGIQSAAPAERLGVLWLDGHGDCNTPETFTGTFLDAMGLSTLTGRCWQALAATVPGFQPLPDEQVVLLGAHGTDAGARAVLAGSRIDWVQIADGPASRTEQALAAALARLEERGVTQLYLHLDVDVLDARHCVANEFAPEGGLLPDQLAHCIEIALARFPVAAAGIASYDPAFDAQGDVREAALRVLEALARTTAPRA